MGFVRKFLSAAAAVVIVAPSVACAAVAPSGNATQPIARGEYRALDFVEVPSKAISPRSRFLLKDPLRGVVLGHVTEETTYAVDGVAVVLRSFEAAMRSAPPYRIDVSVPSTGTIGGIDIRMRTPWKRSR